MFATPRHPGQRVTAVKPGERTLDWEYDKKLHEQATSWNGFHARDGRVDEIYDLNYVYDPSQTPQLYQPDQRMSKGNWRGKYSSSKGTVREKQEVRGRKSEIHGRPLPWSEGRNADTQITNYKEKRAYQLSLRQARRENARELSRLQNLDLSTVNATGTPHHHLSTSMHLSASADGGTPFQTQKQQQEQQQQQWQQWQQQRQQQQLQFAQSHGNLFLPHMDLAPPLPPLQEQQQGQQREQREQQEQQEQQQKQQEQYQQQAYQPSVAQVAHAAHAAHVPGAAAAAAAAAAVAATEDAGAQKAEAVERLMMLLVERGVKPQVLAMVRDYLMRASAKDRAAAGASGGGGGSPQPQANGITDSFVHKLLAMLKVPHPELVWAAANKNSNSNSDSNSNSNYISNSTFSNNENDANSGNAANGIMAMPMQRPPSFHAATPATSTNNSSSSSGGGDGGGGDGGGGGGGGGFRRLCLHGRRAAPVMRPLLLPMLVAMLVRRHLRGRLAGAWQQWRLRSLAHRFDARVRLLGDSMMADAVMMANHKHNHNNNNNNNDGSHGGSRDGRVDGSGEPSQGASSMGRGWACGVMASAMRHARRRTCARQTAGAFATWRMFALQSAHAETKADLSAQLAEALQGWEDALELK